MNNQVKSINKHTNEHRDNGFCHEPCVIYSLSVNTLFVYG